MKIGSVAVAGLCVLATTALTSTTAFQPASLRAAKVAPSLTSPASQYAPSFRLDRLQVAAEPEATSSSSTESSAAGTFKDKPFNKVMAANRAEIAVRIMRACTELNMSTVAIYGFEDRYSQHRWGADQSFMLDKEESATPISVGIQIIQTRARRCGTA